MGELGKFSGLGADFAEIIRNYQILLATRFWTVLEAPWELGVHFSICLGSGVSFLIFRFLWSRVPRKVPGKFLRSGRDRLEIAKSAKSPKSHFGTVLGHVASQKVEKKVAENQD